MPRTQIFGNQQIEDDTIIDADIATNAAIQFSKLASLTSAHVLLGNGSNVATDTSISGDITISNTGVTTIGSGKVTNTMLVGSITPGKLSVTDTHIIVGNGSGVGADVALSGDATLSDTGALTLSTVNSNTGSFGSSTAIPNFTVNGKGLITAAGTNVVVAPAGTLTGTTLASNVVTSSLTTVGTIGTGTWQGTTIAVDHGGTGQTSYTDGQLLVGNSTGNTLTKSTLTGTSNQITVSNGGGSITLATPQDIATGSSPTFASETLTNTTNQLVLGTTRTVTISATQPAISSRVYTIPDQGAAANIVGDKANYTIGGTWTFNNDTTLASSKKLILTDNSTNTVSLKATNSTTSYTLSLPTTAGTANYFLQTDGSGNTSWQQGGGVGFREDYVVGTSLNNYTGSSTVFNLVNSYNVGGHTLIVTLDGDVQTIGATIDYLETNSTTVTFNNALIIGQKVSFIFSQPPTSTSGIVNSGTATHLSYYGASGTTLSDASSNIINGSYTFSGGAGALTMSGSTIAMGSNKITGLAAATTAGEALRYEQLFGGTVTLTDNLIFNPTTKGIKGTTTNDSATSGNVGEYIESTFSAASGAATNTYGDLTSISLTAGDWDVTAIGIINGGSVTYAEIGISSHSGNSGTGLTSGNNDVFIQTTGGPVIPIDSTLSIPVYRVSIASTTTYYFKQFTTFSSAPNYYGRLSARRVR